jgi:hypothetical protein
MKRTSRQKLALVSSCLIAGGLMWNACGKKKSNNDAPANSEAIAAYPSGLAISVYPQTNSTALNLDDNKEQSVKAKNEEAGKRLRGEGECFPPALVKPAPMDGNETCYEFDSEMIVVNNASGPVYLSGTSDGKSKITGSSEACMVSFTRGKVKQLSAMVDRTLGMVQMMICQAKKSGTTLLPAADGESIDFKAIMDAAATAAGKDPSKMPVSAAKMTRSGTKYVTEIEMKMPSIPGGAAGANDPKEKIILTHNPGSDEATYTGTIVIRRDKDFGAQNADKERILTINYERSGDSVKYKLLTASLNTKISANAVVDGKLDLNVSTNANGEYVDPTTNSAFTQQNDAASGIMMIGYNMNPNTGAGNFAYWVNPGATFDEKPRGFMSSVTADATTGLMSGCASSGAFSQGSIRKSIKNSLEIKPDGSHHPFACYRDSNSNCPLTNNLYYVSTRGQAPSAITLHMYVPVGSSIAGDTWTKSQSTSGAQGLVARQCFAQGSDGVYTIDATKTPDTAGFGLFTHSDSSLPTPPDLGTIK